MFCIHIKYHSWNMLVFYSKQIYLLVSRTQNAILGHQVPRPDHSPPTKKPCSPLQTRSYYSVKNLVRNSLASFTYCNDQPNGSIHTAVRPTEVPIQPLMIILKAGATNSYTGLRLFQTDPDLLTSQIKSASLYVKVSGSVACD